MRKFLILVAVALALTACQTVPDAPTTSIAEKGARLAEIGYVASATASMQLVLVGTLKPDDFGKWEGRAYGGLQVIRVAFMAAEPTNAGKPDYAVLKAASDDAHLSAIQFSGAAATSPSPP